MRVGAVLAARVRRRCRPTSPPSELEHALVNLGIEVESIVDQRRHGAGLRWWSAGCSTIEELTGFKKPIRFCPVDVGRPTAPASRRRSSAAPRNFAAGDLVVVILPGGGAAGRLHDRRPPDLRAQLQRHDLLGPRARASATTTPASSCCRPGRRRDAGRRTPGRWSGWTTSWSTSRSPPTAATQMSVRGLARELSHAFGVRVHATRARPSAPRARRPSRPYPVTVVATRSAATGSPPGVVRGHRPGRAEPEWMQRRLITAGIRSISLPSTSPTT